MTTHKGITLNTNSRKIRFARIFIRSLLKMKKCRPTSSSVVDIHRRTRRIKMVAYSSMARAVGTKRAWSRAVLFKLRIRASHHALMRKRWLGVKKKRVIKTKPSGEVSQADKLRQLVPGGKAMNICSLLEETAHYIECLATQVKVMQSIADHYSS